MKRDYLRIGTKVMYNAIRSRRLRHNPRLEGTIVKVFYTPGRPVHVLLKTRVGFIKSSVFRLNWRAEPRVDPSHSRDIWIRKDLITDVGSRRNVIKKVPMFVRAAPAAARRKDYLRFCFHDSYAPGLTALARGLAECEQAVRDAQGKLREYLQLIKYCGAQPLDIKASKNKILCSEA